MFSRQKSPVKKKFAKAAAPKKFRRQLEPRTVILIKQGVLGVLLMLLVGLLGAGLWYGTRVEFLTLRTVTVSGGETISHELVKKEVEALLEGEYIGLIPRRFAWSYPKEEIINKVIDIPRVKDPQIERVSGTSLHLSFTEYHPHALWCAGKESDQCYFIDTTGFAFAAAPKLEGGAFPRFHTIGTEPALRAQMVTTDDLKAIETLRERMSEELALPIAYVETDIMRDVFLGVAGGGEIKATLRMSPEETYDNLRTILASPEFTDITPGSFQYIDLRFGNKVFVNEEKPGAATTTATSSDESAVLEPVETLTESTVTVETESESDVDIENQATSTRE